MDETSPESKTILIVDDDETITTFFEMLLSREGFKVIPVNSGKSALEKLKAKIYRKVDLVLLDLMMPAPGGYEVLKELQKPDFQKVPIFIVTARALDQGTVGMLRLESNVVEFFNKPIDPTDFKKKLHQHLGTLPKPTGKTADPYDNL